MKKGWKIFGICFVVVALIMAVYCVVCGIASAIQQVPFVESFTSVCGLIKNTVENAPAEEIIETAKIILK